MNPYNNNILYYLHYLFYTISFVFQFLVSLKYLKFLYLLYIYLNHPISTLHSLMPYNLIHLLNFFLSQKYNLYHLLCLLCPLYSHYSNNVINYSPLLNYLSISYKTNYYMSFHNILCFVHKSYESHMIHLSYV